MKVKMRSFGILCLIVGLILILTPAAVLGRPEGPAEGVTGSEDQTGGAGENPDTSPSAGEPPGMDKVSLFLSGRNEVVDLPVARYLTGAVAAQMPASYHKEALKAQAVACYTNVVYSYQREKEDPTESLRGAVIGSDPKIYQGYLSDEELRNKWGDDYDKNREKIASAVESVLGETVTYENEAVYAAFHAISTGKTEDGGDILGEGYPYLKSVVSDGDLLSPRYSQNMTLTAAEFSDAFKKPGISLEGDPSEWVGEAKKTKGGTVTEITVGGDKLTGEKVMELFNLKSAAFDISYDKGFVIQASGYGNGLGMSQYGADFLAGQGADYIEILKHYYTGVEIIT